MSERRNQPWLTYLLIAANLAMFVVELASGADLTKPTPQQMIELGGNFGPKTLNGDWWRLGSSMFLHYGLMHVALNMVCLFQARVVEMLYGRAGFLAIYLIAGLAGGIASLAHAQNVVSAGASGAVFGVFGAFGAYLVLRRAQIAEEVWRKTARQIGMFVVINFAYGMATPRVDMSAHVGGLAAGFAIGAVLLVGAKADLQRTMRSIVAGIAGVAVTAGALMAMPRRADLSGVLETFAGVEHTTVEAYNALVAKAKAGEITDPAFADALDRDVIAPYRKALDEMRKTTKAPDKLQPMFDRLKDYTSARLAAWEAFSAMLHATDDQRDARKTAYHDKEQQTVDALTAYKVELELVKQ